MAAALTCLVLIAASQYVWRQVVWPLYTGDQNAWISVEWLEVGLTLYLNHLRYPRDYFLCVPIEDLLSTLRKRAKYADAQWCSATTPTWGLS